MGKLSNEHPNYLWCEGVMEKALHILIIVLAIFILGVQLGIKHGRQLQTEDLSIKYGYSFTN